MRRLMIILSLGLPMMLMGQKSSDISNSDNSLEKVGVRERIEAAIERGEITREQADIRYAEFRKRMNSNKREQNTE